MCAYKGELTGGITEGIKAENGILIFAEQKKGSIHRVSYELLGKGRELARKLSCPLSCVILGKPDLNLQELILYGADAVYHIEDPSAFEYPDEIVYSRNIIELVKEIRPLIFLLGATNFGRSLGPRIAAALRTGLTADCTQLEIQDGTFVQIRPAFSENILAHILSDRLPQMATVRYREFAEPAKLKRSGRIIVRKALSGVKSGVEFISELTDGSAAAISDADVIVSAGMGVKSAGTMAYIEELACLLNGVVGASRPLVETGVIQKERQIGYSGSRVKPTLYIACGISGAPQHLAGMKESKYIVAINKDPSAPIFHVADYSLIGEVDIILPLFIAEIRRITASTL